jgi:tetratricopeptide (TPR) repeat protein
LIAEGKAEEALAQIEPAAKYFGGFRDAPGSWWVDIVPLQIEALLALKRDKEAADVAEQFGRLASDPEVQKFSKAFTAVARTRKGEHLASLPLYEEAARATKRPDILGLIAVNKGESLLALAGELGAKGETGAAAVRYEEALLSFLRIPALYPMQRMYLPQSTYGAAQAYLGIQDFDRARTAIKELKQNFGATPEAKSTDALSEKLEKRAALLTTPEPKN